MYAGHFAAAYAIRSRVPAAPLFALLIAIGVGDSIHGVLVLAGVERTEFAPHLGSGFILHFADWSHSLGMTLIWSMAFGALFWGRGKAVALACAVAVFSHYVLDLVMHDPDLALYPHSPIRHGLGVWNRWPIGSWFFELAFVVGAWWMDASRRPGAGPRRYATLAVLLMLHLGFSPWAKGIFH